MKQFYLLALFCAVSLMCVFTACDDDNKAATWPDGSEISALYENKSTSLPESNKLMLTYSGGELIGKGVYLKAEEHTLVLYNVFPAEKETFIYNVPLTAAADGYTFAGSSTTAAGTTFDYAGKVMPGAMVLNLTNVVRPENEMRGIWNLVMMGKKKDNPTEWEYPLLFKWEIEPFKMSPDDLSETTTEDAEETINFIGSIGGALLNMMVSDIDFREDGTITAKYAGLEGVNILSLIFSGPTKRPAEDWTLSPQNLCRYYVKDGKLYVILDLQMILKAVQANATKAENPVTDQLMGALEKLMSMGQDGIPLVITTNESGDTCLILNKEQILPLVPLLPLLKGVIPGSDQTMGIDLNELFDSFIKMFEHTTDFEVTINLRKLTVE